MNGTAWVVSYVALWIAVVVLAVAVVALLRQIGVLHARIAPMGTHFAGEGPDLDSHAPAIGLDYTRSSLTVLAFTSPTCTICRELKPSLDALRRQDRTLRLETFDLGDETQAVFDAFSVRSTPYFVTIDSSAHVRGRGVANSMEQLEELIRESRLTSQSAEQVPS
jgi:thiol-disulfide isomerase/thioredoxin